MSQLDSVENLKDIVVKLNRHNRLLRAEIRTLHRRLKDANRGAERNALVAQLQAQKIVELNEKIRNV